MAERRRVLYDIGVGTASAVAATVVVSIAGAVQRSWTSGSGFFVSLRQFVLFPVTLALPLWAVFLGSCIVVVLAVVLTRWVRRVVAENKVAGSVSRALIDERDALIAEREAPAAGSNPPVPKGAPRIPIDLALATQIAKTMPSSPPEPPSLDAVQTAVMTLFAKRDGRALQMDEIAFDLEESRIRTDHAVTQLVERGLLTEQYGPFDDGLYCLTPAGRAFLIQEGLA